MKALKSIVVGCFTATVLTAGSVHAEAISSDTVTGGKPTKLFAYFRYHR